MVIFVKCPQVILDYDEMNVDLDFQIDEQDQSIVLKKEKQSFFKRMIEVLSHLLAELMSPPAIATVSFIFLIFCYICLKFYTHIFLHIP